MLDTENHLQHACMGLFANAFRLTKAATELVPSSSATTTAMRSPWSTGQLQKVVYADVFGTDVLPVTRSEAMSVPAVAKARHLITSLSRNPIRCYRGEDGSVEQPAWMYRTNTGVAPQTRMLWTLDDLLFSGWSLWATERGSRGRITDAVRVPPEMWQFDGSGRIIVGDEYVSEDQVVLFSGPFEGLLEVGERTIRAGRNLEEQWSSRVKSPIPLVELRQTVDEQLEDDEVDALINAYVEARKDPNGAVSFVPYGLELHVHGDVKTELFVEARNALTLDIARFTGIPANLLDASLSAASLTYTTQESKRSDFLDMAVPMWLSPVEARLSMDDVVPSGQRIGFDLSNLVAVPSTGVSPSVND